MLPLCVHVGGQHFSFNFVPKSVCLDKLFYVEFLNFSFDDPADQGLWSAQSCKHVDCIQTDSEFARRP